jgi:hypothetical protein
MVKVSHNDSVPVMSHIESSIINRYESGVKIECSRDCSTKRNEICNIKGDDEQRSCMEETKDETMQAFSHRLRRRVSTVRITSLKKG